VADLIGGNVGAYQITERLGRGGMADVYKAFHKDLEVYRAIKFIRPELGESEDFRTRFLKEAQGVAKLQHPNIVGIYDFGATDDRYYMVMELVEGQSLKEILKTEGRLSIDRSVNLVKAVAGALAYAHERGLIHRDIKPDNIMVDQRGRPVLMDFGIAKLITGDAKITQTGHLIGTPAYMAPEQSKGLEVGPATDIYALTVLLFELLTGHTPFEADTPMAVVLKSLSDPMPMPRSFNANISEELQGVILKGTTKEMAERYPSALEFIAALDRAMDKIRPALEKTVVLPQSPSIVKTGSNASTFVVLALLFVVLGGGLAWWFFGRGAPELSVPEVTPEVTVAQKSDAPALPQKDVVISELESASAEPITSVSPSAAEAAVITSPAPAAVVTTEPVEEAATPAKTRPKAPGSDAEEIARLAEQKRLANIARAEEDARMAAERAAEDRRRQEVAQRDALAKRDAEAKAAADAAAKSAKNLLPRAVPEMLSIPAGRFAMGCAPSDSSCLPAEQPAREVNIRAFKLSRHEITFDQYDAFAIATGRTKPDDKGWGRGNRPVMNVNWDDAQGFVAWLSKQTGSRYRLPTEAEWEYAARGSAKTTFIWGNEVGLGNANCTGCGSNWDGDRTSPVGSFAANSHGLQDVHGNVWEWVQDCWQEGYGGAPADGSARVTGNCSARVLRGGSWLNNPSYLRLTYRNWLAASLRDVNTGFRVAQD